MNCKRGGEQRANRAAARQEARYLLLLLSSCVEHLRCEVVVSSLRSYCPTAAPAADERSDRKSLRSAPVREHHSSLNTQLQRRYPRSGPPSEAHISPASAATPLIAPNCGRAVWHCLPDIPDIDALQTRELCLHLNTRSALHVSEIRMRHSEEKKRKPEHVECDVMLLWTCQYSVEGRTEQSAQSQLIIDKSLAQCHEHI